MMLATQVAAGVHGVTWRMIHRRQTASAVQVCTAGVHRRARSTSDVDQAAPASRSPAARRPSGVQSCWLAARQ